MSEKTFNDEYEEFVQNMTKPNSWIWESWKPAEALMDIYYGGHTSGPMKTPSKEFQEGLLDILYHKREFGIKKYGDASFQACKENAMSVDMVRHAKDELVDYLNYTMHSIYQATQRGDLGEIEYCKKRFQIAVTLYYMTR